MGVQQSDAHERSALHARGEDAGARRVQRAGEENERQAQLLAEEICTALARGGGAEAEPTLERVCKARVTSVTKKCGGDGTRRLLDDTGRFNPGHGRCYTALSDLVREIVSLRGSAGACCACLGRSCGASESQCIERQAQGKALEVFATCAEHACAADCAQLWLVQPAAATTRKP